MLCCVVLCCVVLCWVGLGWVGLGWVGLGCDGKYSQVGGWVSGWRRTGMFGMVETALLAMKVYLRGSADYHPFFRSWTRS